MQPQWPPGDLARPFHYTHSQPQWGCVLGTTTTTTLQALPESGSPPVLRAASLAPARLCASCHFSKEACHCRRCSVCATSVGRGTRHHCRSCWRAVCSECWTESRHVHMLGSPMRVCDRCAVPAALANLCKREERGMYWGLYLLRRAGKMPCMCVAPSCSTYTYRAHCYRCGTPTVMTQPHVERLLRVTLSRLEAVDHVRLIDAQHMSLRAMEVDHYTAEEVSATFRRCFHRYEEVVAFREVLCAAQSQHMLLAMVSAAISYEYNSAPNITLALSDVPYAKLLRLVLSKPRYTILEAPGKVKFVSFPGTHNWRTGLVDVKFSQVVRTVMTPLVDGVRVDAATGQTHHVHGGVRTLWEYRVHSGFAQEALEAGLPMEELIADVRRGYRLVFSGHSLGGAVAQLLTLEMLARYPELSARKNSFSTLDDERTVPPPLMCISLGAPLVGNYQLAERVTRSGWAHLFHHFVYRSDIVPRLFCGDELTWDAAAHVAKGFSDLYRSVYSWFGWTGSSGGGSGANTGGGASPQQQEELEEQHLRDGGHTLEDFVDSTIRAGRDVLTEDEDCPPSEQDRARRRASIEAALSAPSTPHHSKSNDDNNNNSRRASSAAAAEEAALAAPNRAIHRRFACFGRYHFLRYGSSAYVSTSDSETAFGLLKKGSGDPTTLLDHSIAAYNRGIMLHLYGQWEGGGK